MQIDFINLISYKWFIHISVALMSSTMFRNIRIFIGPVWIGQCWHQFVLIVRDYLIFNEERNPLLHHITLGYMSLNMWISQTLSSFQNTSLTQFCLKMHREHSFRGSIPRWNGSTGLASAEGNGWARAGRERGTFPSRGAEQSGVCW